MVTKVHGRGKEGWQMATKMLRGERKARKGGRVNHTAGNRSPEDWLP